MVLNQDDGPAAVLSGSTNWTSTGLCTQTNNVLVIESAEVARRYIAYWNRLKDDVDAAGGDQKKLQSPTLRTSNHQNNQSSISTPITLDGGVTVEVMFSPNTNHPLASPPREKPNDMERIFDLIAGAQQAVLFLAFDPGSNSILDAAGAALARNPNLFVRGALTSSQRASNFSAALHQGGATDQHERAAAVTVVGEAGKPKKKGAKAPALPPDFRAVPAGAITPDDAFGAFEAELAKFGFAIIHNKIVVIDPFTDNCTVITGSHNLGFRASHNNDENMVIVRGHRKLAEAYTCHVLDIYDHYAWRFLLKQHPDIFGRPLDPDDKWQERYIIGPNEKSPELHFWLSAAQATAGSAAPALKTSGATSNRTAKRDAGKTSKPAKVKSSKKAKKATKKNVSSAKKRPKKPARKPPAKKRVPRKKKRA